MPDAEALLDFWFAVDLDDPAALAGRSRVWFAEDPVFDEAVRTRFSGLLEAAGDGALEGWHEAPRTSLALVILLDQVPRNVHRGDARAFAHDGRALAASEAGIARGHDRALHPVERIFHYMPMQHAEDLAVQERSVAVYEALASAAPAPLRERLDACADFAREHRDVIARFGRFPHRNPILGRDPTAEEQAWLAAGGATFGQAPGARGR